MSTISLQRLKQAVEVGNEIVFYVCTVLCFNFYPTPQCNILKKYDNNMYNLCHIWIYMIIHQVCGIGHRIYRLLMNKLMYVLVSVNEM